MMGGMFFAGLNFSSVHVNVLRGLQTTALKPLVSLSCLT